MYISTCLHVHLCMYNNQYVDLCTFLLPQTNKYKLHFKENNCWVCRVYFLCKIIKMVFLPNTVRFVALNKIFRDLRIHEAYRSHFISQKITIKIPFDVLLHFFIPSNPKICLDISISLRFFRLSQVHNTNR